MDEPISVDEGSIIPVDGGQKTTTLPNASPHPPRSTSADLHRSRPTQRVTHELLSCVGVGFRWPCWSSDRKRESGENPELPRSGEWKRPRSSSTGIRPGKRPPIGVVRERRRMACPRVRRPATAAAPPAWSPVDPEGHGRRGRRSRCADSPRIPCFSQVARSGISGESCACSPDRSCPSLCSPPRSGQCQPCRH